MEDSVAALLRQRPLMLFSTYTEIQRHILEELAQALEGSLDAALAQQGVMDGSVSSIYGQTWLWVLGAYEMVRTMAQAKECFEPRTLEALEALKKALSIIRMPFAKQEFANTHFPIGADASIAGMSWEARDLIFRIGEQRVFVRALIGEWRRVLAAVEPSHILRRHGMP